MPDFPVAKGKAVKFLAFSPVPPKRPTCPIYGCGAKLTHEVWNGVKVVCCTKCNWGGGTVKVIPQKKGRK
jgi:hypothetical protein